MGNKNTSKKANSIENKKIEIENETENSIENRQKKIEINYNSFCSSQSFSCYYLNQSKYFTKKNSFSILN